MARTRIWLILLGAMGLTGARAAELPRPKANSALTNWLTATTSFQRAGVLVGSGKYVQAGGELASEKTTLPAPYGAMAEEYLAGLETALKLSTNKVDAARDRALLQVCTELRAYGAALDIERRGTTNEEELGEEP